VITPYKKRIIDSLICLKTKKISLICGICGLSSLISI
jgi:hypothetical protein